MAITRLFDFLFYQQENAPLERAMGARNDKGQWSFYSTAELIDAAEKLASGLLKIGIKAGDKVAMVSYKNRPEWTIVDLATQMIGVINVPLYPTISSREYQYILDQAEVRLAFCGGDDLYEKLSVAKKKVSSLENIYTFDQEEGNPFWKEVFDNSKIEEVRQFRQTVKEDDLATIIYTSGTTGNPKGVMLTHKNIVVTVINTCIVIPDNPPGSPILSFLPLCHIFERAVSFAMLYKSFSVHFTGTDNLGGPDGDLADVKPIMFTTVPRLLEKVYEKIYNKGLDLSGVKKRLFFWALKLTEDYDIGQKRSFVENIKWSIADKLIFSKWRAALGGQVGLVITGAAPCPHRILQVFNAAGIRVREGYGLTETSPTIAINRLEEEGTGLGTVGPVLEGVEVIIDESESEEFLPGEGEILAKGDNVFQGYYKNPEATEACFKTVNGERWFCTGDVGKLVDGGAGKPFLKITDRKKELFKTSGGKYVAPAPIENRLKEDFFVEQIMLIGDKRKFVAALIIPAEETLKNWFEEKDYEWKGLDQAIEQEAVQNLFQSIIDQYNLEFSKVEQIKKFKLLSSPWLPIHESGAEAELTPTLKLKRRVIHKKNEAVIDLIYKE